MKGAHTYLELYRDGRRRGRIAQPHWDFLRQDALPSEAAASIIHPGDALLTRCVFNTRNSTSLLPPYVSGHAAPGGEHDVFGGFGTYNEAERHFEEMCYGAKKQTAPRAARCVACQRC